MKFIVLAASISQGSAQGNQDDEERGEGWFVAVFAAGQLFVLAGFIFMLGALVAHRVSRKSLRMRSIEEEPKDSEKKGNEAEETSKKREDADETLGGVRKRVVIPKDRERGSPFRFSALRVSINAEWRITISTDQGDPRGALRMLEEIGARRSVGFQPKEEVEKGVRFLR